MLMLDFASQGQAAEPVPVMAKASGDAAASEPSGASAKAVAQAKRAAQPGPAALDPDGHGIEVLEEGGLLEGKVYTGRRISLDFKDVEIDDVLRLIAEVSDLNIIAGDEVAGQVTIRLVDVPWDQALDVILVTKGLGFVRVGNVLRIAPSEVLKSEEEARLQEKRAKEKLEDLVVKLQPVNYANVKEVSKMVKRLLTARGSVDVDIRTNTVILKDIASVIDEATALIKAIDTQTPQVMIEAKIVEANLDYLREVGSRWGVGVQPYQDAFDPGSDLREDAGGSDFTLQPVQNILGNTVAPNNIAVSNPITELATGVVNVGAFLLDDRFNLDVELEAAESEGEGKVISSPRVVTLDNRKASIEQGVSIPFQTFENGDAKLEFIDAVLRLDVTPHITQDKSIIMKIEVQRNAPDDSVPTPTGSPAIAKNEAETETLVRDGQTLVIGGIYVVRSADRQSRVPYLHKLPILGNAFKNNETREVRQELLLFVTPRVVVNPELGA
jgi:type IV pilus assembly protein PilQ